MSVSFWWMHVALTREQADAMQEPMTRALAALADIRKSLAARWSQLERSPNSQEALVSFVEAFAHSATAEVGDQITRVIDHGNALRFISTPRVSPAAILFRALGPVDSESLPGELCNVLLSVDEVAAAERAVQAVLERHQRAQLVARGAEVLRLDHYPCDAGVEEVLDAWPAALAEARRRKVAMLSLAMRAV
ncbi:MAG TPA: hypothetical protein VKB34_07425 [Povalibacter sp.]|nr:hypothetical protein [Povalibacter sp.]